MPKQVDHDGRRQELAEAACVVVARGGVDGASLRAVADEAGWSVGSIRHYFTTKAELLEFAVNWIGTRVGIRIAAAAAADAGAGADRSALSALRAAAVEMLPLDVVRRHEALVWLAFVGRAGVDPSLRPAADRVWRSIKVPLAGHLHDAMTEGEVRADLDIEGEAVTLQSILDGLTLSLLTTEGFITDEQALAVLDGFLDRLRMRPDA